MDMKDSFFDDLQDWEPKDAEEWERYDPIGPYAEWPRFNDNIEHSAYSAKILYSGWRNLPSKLRAQAWREREIAAYLFRNSGEWAKKMPILVSVGVTKRNLQKLGGLFPFFPEFPEWDHPIFYEYWQALRHGDFRRVRKYYEEIQERWGIPLANNQTITGTLFIKRSIPITENLFNFLNLRTFQEINSRISNYSKYGLSPLVPINIEYSDEFMLLKKKRNNSGQTIQSGKLIWGEHPSGFRKLGTLTTFAKYKGNNENLILGAQHVLGETGNKVFCNGEQVGEVVESDAAIDASLAKIFDFVTIEKYIGGLSIEPAAPVFPTTGISVQYEGGVSGTHFGIVDTVNHFAPGQYKVGSSPCFTVITDGKPGDSGSLIITGHGIQSPIPQSYINQNPDLATLYSSAMLGMLLAGPGPSYPKNELSKIIARPILDIGARFGLIW